MARPLPAPARLRRPMAARLMAALLLAVGMLAAGVGAGGPGAGAAPVRVGGMDMPQPVTAASAARLRSDGMDTVSLFVAWWADSQSSDGVHPGSGTQSDDQVVASIQAARAAGLRVVLAPIFYCGDCEGYWRGTMQPSDPNAFFDSYAAFIDHYAAIAQANGVWMLFVGSEMTTLESYTSRWRQVIAGARSAYQGLIAYEVNWDVLGQAHFLDAVDVVGVSAYFPLDDRSSPSLDQLVSDWTDSQASATSGRDWVGALTHLAATTGKPIIFGEIGYMATTYAARQPFLNFVGQPDPALQADLYQALLQSFDGASWWMGALWWEWTGTDGSGDLRTPMGRPAESLIQSWYAQGWRPAPAGSPAPSGPSTATSTLSAPAPAPTAAPTGAPATEARRGAQAPYASPTTSAGPVRDAPPPTSPLGTAAVPLGSAEPVVSRGPSHPLAMGALAAGRPVRSTLARRPPAVIAAVLLLALVLAASALLARRPLRSA